MSLLTFFPAKPRPIHVVVIEGDGNEEKREGRAETNSGSRKDKEFI